MTLCQLMQMDYHGILEGDPIEAYSEYDLQNGINYCEGWLEAGYTWDTIGQFNLRDFMAWCKNQLVQRSTRGETK